MRHLLTRVAVISETEIGHYGICGLIQDTADLECNMSHEFPIVDLAVPLGQSDVVVVMMTNPRAIEEKIRAIHALRATIPIVAVVDATALSKNDVIGLLQEGIVGLTTSLASATIICLVRLAAQRTGFIDMSVVQDLIKVSDVDRGGFL